MRIVVSRVIAATAVWAAMGVCAVAQDVPVSDLQLEREGAFTVLTVPVNGDFLCDHFVEPPKHGKPFRIILDFCGAIHSLPRKNFEQLPPGLVQRIRTSQYRAAPEMIVRVVLDLNREVTYKLSTDDVVRLMVATPEEPPMAAWSASGESTDAPQLAVAQEPEVKQVPPKPKTVPAPSAQPKRETPKVPEKPAVARAEQPKPKPLAVKPAAQPTGSKTEMLAAQGTKDDDFPTAPPPKVKRSPALEVPQMAADDKPTAPPPTVRKSPAPTAPQVPEMAADDEPTAPSGTAMEHTSQTHPNSQAGPWTAEPVESTQPDVDGYDGRPVLPDPVMLAEEQKETAPPIVIDEEDIPEIVEVQPREKSLLERLKEKFIGDDDEPAPELPLTEEDAAHRIRKLAETAKATADESAAPHPEPPVVAPTAEQHVAVASDSLAELSLEEKVRLSVGGTATFGPVDPSNLTAMRGALQARIDSIAAAGGNVNMGLTLTDVRPTVEYVANISRDPFDALVEGLRTGFVGDNIPDPEALRLVGILEDWAGSIALLEDMEGYGYVLHEGDPVKRGWVTRITDESIIFQIEEYGWSHPFALKLAADHPMGRRSHPVGMQPEVELE